jgi:hypothetical protein
MTGQTHALRSDGDSHLTPKRRISTLDWPRIEAALDADGYTAMGPILSASECRGIVRGYDDGAASRKRIVMERHGFGKMNFPAEVFDASTMGSQEIVLHHNKQSTDLARLGCVYPHMDEEPTAPLW